MPEKCMQELGLIGFPSRTDSRLLALHGGIPAYMFSLGKIEAAYTVDEFALVGDVIDFVRIYAMIRLNWCNKDPETRK